MAYKESFELSVTNGDTTVNIEATTGEPPYATPVGYPIQVEQASGLVREHGGQVCEWRFGPMTESQYDALRTILNAKSKTVWIRTLSEDGKDYAYYTGICVFPSAPSNDVTYASSPKFSTSQLILRFRNLTTYTPTPPP